jgi:Ran GTPase-activating protein (RanGAP) involved in mRNA processing and transport
VRVLAAMLRVNKTLHNLDISSNSLGPEAGGVMRDALEENKSLTALDLRVNKIAPDLSNAIRDLVRRNEQPQTGARATNHDSRLAKNATQQER